MTKWAATLTAAFLMLLSLGATQPPQHPPQDWDIPGGHFYQQANGQGGAGNTGFAVTDDAQASFWSAFQHLGGVERVGYPISGRFSWRGFTTQAFQKLILQWRPELGAAYPVNLFDELSAAGKDPWLQEVKAVPPSQDWASDGGLAWEEIVQNHLALLEQNPAIKAAYFSPPDPITVFGLPMGYADYGEVAVLRAQRAVFQQWRVEVPWAHAGQVVIANGGDLAKEAGLLPEWALTPQAAPSSSVSSGAIEPLVLASYYSWYDADDWSLEYFSDLPALPYNSDDPEAMGRHIAQAQGVGIDAFVVAWLGPGDRTDRNFARLLELAAARGFRLAISMQMHILPGQSREAVRQGLAYVIANYGHHSAYLRHQGRPVIFFTDMPRVPLAGGETAPQAWRSIRQQVDPASRTIWIAEGLDPSYLDGFDGLYVIKIDHRDYPHDYVKLPRWGANVRTFAARLGQPKLWVASIMPGWDDLASSGHPSDFRQPSPPFARDREDGAYYRRTFDYALASAPDWLFVQSFNEWAEGTQIEPSLSYGDRYLDLTREFSRRFKTR